MIIFNSIETVALGPVSIYVHGLFMALGVLVAYLALRREAGKRGIAVEHLDGILYAGVLGGLLGARVLYVVLNWQLYDSVWSLFKVWEGGLVSFGGLGGGILAAFLYMKLKKLTYWKIADLAGPYLLLGWGVGRIGDLLAWDEIGTASELPWALAVDGDIPRHPAQLYSSIALIGLFLGLQYFVKRRDKVGGGLVFGASLVSYGLFRFLIEFVRDYPESEYLFSYRSFAQIVSAVVVLGGATIIFLARKKFNEGDNKE